MTLRIRTNQVVVAIGETMISVTPPRAESLASAEEVFLDVAGAEANVASHLARLGRKSSWLGRVGDDPLGRRILSVLSRRGVDVGGAVVDRSAPTGVMFKEPGVGVYYYRSGSAGSMLGPALLKSPQLDNACVVHVSGVTAALSGSAREMLAQLLETRDRPFLVSFDVNFRAALWENGEAASELLSLANKADVVFVGLDEAEELWGSDSPKDVRELLPEPEMVVVKDGEVGAWEFSSEGRTFSAARDVSVIEAVGAGDAFAAGFLSELCAGQGSRARLEAGHARAAAVLLTTRDYDEEDSGDPIH